ncbi:NAD(P)-dependent oxidoreductase [Rhodococcus koreensis]
MTGPVVGFIGTGQIGEPMVERLVSRGFPTRFHARRSEVRDRLAAHGGEPVSDPLALAEADVVIACLFDDQQLLDAGVPILHAMRAGTTFVSHTTGSPDTVHRLQRVARERGVAVVEAPFSGTADAVRNGALMVMLAGTPDAVEAARPVVAAYASTTVPTGDLGSAVAMKLLNNALFAACTQLTLSALGAARSLGISDECFFDVLAGSSGGSRAADNMTGSRMTTEEYCEHLPRYLRKDVAAALGVADRMDLDITHLVETIQHGPLDLVRNEDHSPATETAAALTHTKEITR